MICKFWGQISFGYLEVTLSTMGSKRSQKVSSLHCSACFVTCISLRALEEKSSIQKQCKTLETSLFLRKIEAVMLVLHAH